MRLQNSRGDLFGEFFGVVNLFLTKRPKPPSMAELTKSKDVAVPEVPNLLNGGQLTKLGRRGRPGKRAIILAVNRDRLNWQTNSFFKGANATSGECLLFC